MEAGVAKPGPRRPLEGRVGVRPAWVQIPPPAPCIFIKAGNAPLCERRIEVKPTGPTNPRLIRMINRLEKASRVNNAPIWRAVAEKLRRPTRARIEVNLWKIEKYAEGETAIIVPGKVLGEGEITKPVIVAAASFSSAAKKKIEEAGGKAYLLDEYMEENPKGSNTRIVI